MTLALLLTAVTGAWAQEETLLTTITPTAKEQASYSTANVATVSFSYTADGSSAYLANWGWWGYGWIATVTAAEGYTITKCIFYDDADRTATDSEAPFVVETTDEDKTPRINGTPIDGGNQWSKGINKIEVYGYVTPTAPTEPGVDVTPGSSANTWTFSMPGSDVVLTPIYAKAAAFATTGTEPEVKTLLPEAAEGVIAGTDASLIAEGTGIVAFAGTSTEVTQGQVMYFATTDAEMTAEKAAQANGWLATVPTAEGYDDAQTVYVWYYIKGADTPEGQTATAENTFNDSEICTEPITVNVLSNKFDIQFKAANDNTIETGKATVTVGGTAATVTEGKLEDVKMGTEVKVTAKDGYKFRKVEVKKGAPTTTVTWNSSDFYFDENPYTKDGVTLTPSIMGAASGNNLYEYGDNTFTTTLGKFIKIEIVFRDYSSPVIDGWTKETAGQYQPSPEQLPDFWADIYKLTWTGNADSVTLKGKDVYGILSITFTIQ